MLWNRHLVRLAVGGGGGRKDEAVDAVTAALSRLRVVMVLLRGFRDEANWSLCLMLRIAEDSENGA